MIRPLLLLLSIGMASPAFAPAFAQDDWEAGAEAYVRGDYPEALRILSPLAQQGQPEAQNSLGVLYFNGFGVEQDFAVGLRWYYEAAKQHYAKAQYNLAQAYELGQGVEKDYGLAFQWYRLAADNGLIYAQYSLGTLYARGAGVEQSFPDAYLWFEIAARQLPTGSDRLRAEQGRELVSRYLPLEMIAELDAKAAAWKPRNAQ